MKLIRIIEDVSLPNMPGFKKGQQVRVNIKLAEILCERGHAKEERGKSESEVKAAKVKIPKEEVSVTKTSKTINNK